MIVNDGRGVKRWVNDDFKYDHLLKAYNNPGGIFTHECFIYRGQKDIGKDGLVRFATPRLGLRAMYMCGMDVRLRLDPKTCIDMAMFWCGCRTLGERMLTECSNTLFHPLNRQFNADTDTIPMVMSAVFLNIGPNDLTFKDHMRALTLSRFR